MGAVEAVVLAGPGRPLERRQYAPPRPEPGGAILETVASEVCGTDVHLFHGHLAGVPYPIIPGHVSVGRVLETAFRAALDGRMRFVVEDDRLTLTASGGTILVFRAEPEPTLEGSSWNVTGYNNGRQALVSLILDTSLTLMFREGTVSGSSGCNSYRAP